MAVSCLCEVSQIHGLAYRVIPKACAIPELPGPLHRSLCAAACCHRASARNARCCMIAWTDYETGSHRIECPSCGRGGRDKTAGLTMEIDGKGVVHCFRCSYTESHHPERGAAVRRAPIIKPAHKPQVQQYQRLSDWGRDLWRNCHPLNGMALQYLRSRHCAIPPQNGHLRWHPSLKHPSGYAGPALVALITDVETNEHLSLHRTWITPTGKADLDTPRLPLWNHSTKNGVIRLWPD